MELILQLTEQGRFILNDISTLFEGNSFGKNNSPGNTGGGFSTISDDSGQGFISMIPPIELFGSISKISVEMYQKSKTSSVHPILLLNIIQPSLALNTVGKVQSRLMIQDLDILTTMSDSEMFLKDTPFPMESDYDQRIVTCKDTSMYFSDRASLPAFLQVSVVLTDTDGIDLNVFVGRSVHADLNAASIKNIGRLSQMLPNNNTNQEISPPKAIKINNDADVTEQQSSIIEEKSKINLQLRHVDFSTKSLLFNYTSLQQTFSVSVYCHGIEAKSDLTYSMQQPVGFTGTCGGNVAKTISCQGHINGLRIGLGHCDGCEDGGREVDLLSPMKIKIQLLVELLT